jgi:hypothetical protein
MLSVISLQICNKALLYKSRSAPAIDLFSLFISILLARFDNHVGQKLFSLQKRIHIL